MSDWFSLYVFWYGQIHITLGYARLYFVLVASSLYIFVYLIIIVRFVLWPSCVNSDVRR